MHTVADKANFGTLKVIIGHIEPNTYLVQLSGELDSSNYREMADFIMERAGPHESAAVLDLTELRFADSSGIKLMEKMRRRYGTKNLGIYGINRNIARILEIAGYSSWTFLIDKPVDVREWHRVGREAA